MLGFCGETVRFTSCAGVTVNEVVPETLPQVAEMFAYPTARPEARPCVLVLLLTVATVGSEELQCTDDARSCVVPSLKLPLALNCCVVPRGIDEASGEIVIDSSTVEVTVKVAVPVTLPEDATMRVSPGAIVRAIPDSSMVATAGELELHATTLVRIFVVESLYTPVAVYCWSVAGAMLQFAGLTVMDTNTAGLTVNTVEPETDPKVAEMLVVPVFILLARPLVLSPLLIVATVPSEELQCAVAVRSCVLRSVKVPVAVNC
jgi:hypothetical protein